MSAISRRMALAGFVPASPTGRVDRRNMACPKPRSCRWYIPPLPEHALSWLAGKLGPDERLCLRHIVETADLIEVDGTTYVLAEAPPVLVDTLAQFETAGADREPYLEDEADEGKEDDRDSDNAMETSWSGRPWEDEEDDDPEDEHDREDSRSGDGQ